MPLMTWNDSFSVGIPSIDRQHQVIINTINELHDLIHDGGTNGVLASILRGLASYTRVHFAYEEMLFKRHDYPSTADHRASHERLLRKVLMYKDRFNGGEKNIAPELLEFLKEWLYHHIMEDDMAYSAHLRERGAK